MTLFAEETVRSFLARFAAPDLDEIMSYFNDDAVYQDPRPCGVHRGIDALREEFRKQLAVVPTTDLKITSLVCDGGLVMLERSERFEMGGRTVSMEGALVLEIDPDGKISRMRDYYDRAQFGQG